MRKGLSGLILAILIIFGFMYLHDHPEKLTKEDIAQTTREAYDNKDEYYRKYKNFAERFNKKATEFLAEFGFSKDIEEPTPEEPAIPQEDISVEPTSSTDSTYFANIYDEVKLIDVIDGDTILVETSSGERIKVRFIGIDTPESVHSDETRNNIYGKKASDYTKSLLADCSSVFLEYDTSKIDQYGRTLAYVRRSADDTDPEKTINYILVNDGYAYNKVFLPNNRYADLLEAARIDAENSGRGLWADESFAALWEG